MLTRFLLAPILAVLILLNTTTALASDDQAVPAPANTNLLIQETEAITARIDKMLAETQLLQQQQSLLSGEDYEALGRRIATRQLTILDELERLCSYIIKQHEQGLDIEKTRQYASTLLIAAGKTILSYIDKIEADALTNSTFTTSAHIPLDILYKALHRQTQLMQSINADTEKELKILEKRLILRAEWLSGKIESNKEAEQEVRRKIRNEPSNDELKLKLLSIREDVSIAAKSLATTIRILQSMGIDSNRYQKVLIKNTGDITTDILNKAVITGLVNDWLSESITIIRSNGSSLIFKLVIFLLVLFIFKILAGITGKLVERSVKRSPAKLSKLFQNMLISSASRVVMIIGILMALAQIGVSLGPVLAGLGVAGFIAGFALQDTLGNFASGMMILFYRPFDNGDLIETGGVLGRVSSMNLVATTLLTTDNQTMIIPNSKIWGDVIKNITSQKMRRVDMVFSISYSDDIAHAETVLQEIVNAHEQVLKDPAPNIRLHKLNEYSIDFIVRPWSKTEDYWNVYWDITREVKMRFDRENISIPFPQRDLHIHQTLAKPTS